MLIKFKNHPKITPENRIKNVKKLPIFRPMRISSFGCSAERIIPKNGKNDSIIWAFSVSE